MVAMAKLKALHVKNYSHFLLRDWLDILECIFSGALYDKEERAVPLSIERQVLDTNAGEELS
jgi:hypothetical protein